MQGIVTLTKACGDATRVRILGLLREGELCVCQILEVCGLAPSTVSRHLAVLQQAGLLCSRKDGKWMYYRRAGREAPAAVRRLLAWIDAGLDTEPQARRDARRLAVLTRLDPAEICSQQRARKA